MVGLVAYSLRQDSSPFPSSHDKEYLFKFVFITLTSHGLSVVSAEQVRVCFLWKGLGVIAVVFWTPGQVRSLAVPLSMWTGMILRKLSVPHDWLWSTSASSAGMSSWTCCATGSGATMSLMSPSSPTPACTKSSGEEDGTTSSLAPATEVSVWDPLTYPQVFI